MLIPGTPFGVNLRWRMGVGTRFIASYGRNPVWGTGRRAWEALTLAPLVGNPFHIRHLASQTKPLQECHPERSEGSLAEQRSFAPLRACARREGMTKREGLFFEMY